mmetsp:Transcript_6978/g.12219  ORF Transcript_6978/g.12219 Transcript_6978/m.12219 type:complete len:201 (-) Transcript_6978:570-1172(-)
MMMRCTMRVTTQQLVEENDEHTTLLRGAARLFVAVHQQLTHAARGKALVRVEQRRQFAHRRLRVRVARRADQIEHVGAVVVIAVTTRRTSAAAAATTTAFARLARVIVAVAVCARRCVHARTVGAVVVAVGTVGHGRCVHALTGVGAVAEQRRREETAGAAWSQQGLQTAAPLPVADLQLMTVHNHHARLRSRLNVTHTQ